MNWSVETWKSARRGEGTDGLVRLMLYDSRPSSGVWVNRLKSSRNEAAEVWCEVVTVAAAVEMETICND